MTDSEMKIITERRQHLIAERNRLDAMRNEFNARIAELDDLLNKLTTKEKDRTSAVGM
jgi:peptidoglycan hydrolase CwlO-like protein